MKQFKAYDRIKLTTKGLMVFQGAPRIGPARTWAERRGTVLYTNRGHAVCLVWDGSAAE